MGGLSRTRLFKLAKGFRGRAKNCIRVARQRVEKGLQYQYRDRRAKKRTWREQWILRVSAGSRLEGVKYSELIHGLAKENIELNRKMLSELSANEPLTFRSIVRFVSTALGRPALGSGSILARPPQ